ncbi:DUF1801 domain-containing protein [Patescibacteria group bacterium]|nr:MAG: DUF1801 domain-containing protein [Patescibacteria group bacterium]
MAKDTNKTIPKSADVEDFLTSVPEGQATDSRWLIEAMQKVTGEPPVMWGSSIIGFGKYHYKYESGREGDMPLMGFSPRKGKLTLYITYKPENYTELMNEVGKHQTSKACFYIKDLASVNQEKLRELIQKTYDEETSKL